MSESSQQFLPAATAAEEDSGPTSLEDTRRARRARIEALEASLRSEFAVVVPNSERGPDPVPLSEPMRRFGTVMAARDDAASEDDAAPRR
jgi:hypothetical protein